MEDDLLALMPDTIVVTTGPASRDLAGVPTYSGGGTTYAARVVYKTMHQRGGQGSWRSREGAHHAWVDSTTLFSTGCRVVLSDGTSPPIRNVQGFPDENGMHHVKIFFGWSEG